MWDDQFGPEYDFAVSRPRILYALCRLAAIW